MNGICPRSRRAPGQKLSDHQVRAIRRSGRSPKLEAVEYGVSPKTIRNVRQAITYKDVPDRPRITEEDIRRRFDGKYETGDVVRLLEEVPDEYAQTILTMRPRLGDRHGEDVHRERRIIEECRRIAGECGVVMYIHRPQCRDDGVMNLGAGILEGLPLRQVIIWTWPVRPGRGIDAVGSRMPLPQNYASVFIFTGRFWTMPDAVAPGFRQRGGGAVWRIAPPHPANAPPEFPLELARRCIALGRGRVLDPQAGTGTVALAAKEQGRDWTLFDSTDAHRDTFKRRLAGKGEPDPPARFSVTRDPMMKRLTQA